MKLKKLVGLSLIIFASCTGMLLFVGLVLTPPSASLGLGQGLTADPGGAGTAANPEGEGSGSGVGASPGATPPAATPSATAAPKAATPAPAAAPAAKTTAPAAAKTPTPAPAPAPTPTPTPAQPACGSANGPCTAAQVAAHNAKTNCWVIYGGYYYIVTSYVNAHPGGTSVFNSSSCGHDIAGYMNGSAATGGQQHSHNGSAYTILNSYRVGPVQG